MTVLDLGLPPLWQHQSNFVERAKLPGGNELALFFDPGTGKTRTLLEVLRWIYNTRTRVERTLIVAPLIVTKNWKDEIKKYTKIPDSKVHTLEGTVAEKAKQLATLEGIVIVNYDIFVRDEFRNAAIAWKPKVLVLDESHRCKEQSAKRTKNMIKLSLSMGPDSYRYLLTGTPITNDQTDLWAQFYILDHGKTFGNNFWAYKSYYFMNIKAGAPKNGKYFPMWVPRPGIDAILADKIKNKAMVVKKEECLDLPPLIFQEVEVELSAEQQRIYKDMKNDFVAFVKNKEAVAQLALTKMLRMQQILSGFLKMEDGSIEKFENPRERVLRELLSDICGTNKVIVWAVFHEDYATIRKVCEELKIGYVEVHGLISEKEKFANITRFQKEAEARVFIGSPQAGGIGINLVEAPISIWYSRNYSLEQDEQAMARNYRGGSEQHLKVTRIDLVARRTIDEVILRAVREKKKIADSILSIDTESF